ncbi:MAG: hypothetical protein ABEI77_01990 [Halorientalis sp.]
MGQVDDTNNEWGDSDRWTGTSRSQPRSSEPTITAHQSDGKHTVFTESGNVDAWIATDVVVSIDR